jgi:hypothetical protein
VDEAGFESLVIRINAQNSMDGLALVAGSEPAVFGSLVVQPQAAPPALVWSEIKLNMGNDKQKGAWVRADGYRLEGKMSNFQMDLTEYDGVNGFRLALDVDLDMSNLRLTVPDGWTIDCRIDDNTASNVKDKGPSGLWGDNLVMIRGRMRMSNIKVKYK